MKINTGSSRVQHLMLFAAASLIHVPVAQADTIPPWVGSYSANGDCYCSEDIPASLSGRIVPTPVGGQTLAQVCRRLGDGPGLSLQDGRFSHPVYPDMQCGNGPAVSFASPDTCQGQTALPADQGECNGTGPVWNIAAAYAAVPEQKLADSVSSQAEPSAVGETAPAEIQVASPEPISTETEADTSLPMATIVQTTTDRSVEELPLATIVSSRVISADEPLTKIDNTPLVTQARKPVVEPVASKSAENPEISKPVNPAPVVVRREPVEVVLPRPRFSEDRQDSSSKLASVEPSIAEDESDDNRIAARAQELPDQEDLTDAGDVAAKTDLPEADAGLAAAKPQPVPVETPQTIAPAASAEAVAEAADDVIEADQTAAGSTAVAVPWRQRRTVIGYIESGAVNYDYGGTGAGINASVGGPGPVHLVGRAAVTEEYSEYMAGVGLALNHNVVNGGFVSVVLGMEYGVFDLDVTDYEDSGAFVTGSLGGQWDSRMALEAGVSYSDFFEGDASLFGQFVYSVTSRLAFSGHIETGDNDFMSLGIRFNF